MCSEVKKPDFLVGLGLQRLPDDPFDVKIVDLDGDLPAMPTRYVLDEAALSSLQQRPVQLLQQSLRALRKQIMSDPEGEDVQEIMESYWARVGMTTLSEVLLAESRIWQKNINEGSTALTRVAIRAYYRIVQHENFIMCATDLFRGSNDLRTRIELGDFDQSRETLDIYQGFVGTFLRGRPDLLAVEISGFRMMAEGKIRNVLSQDQGGDVDADMVSHLNNLLVVYSEFMFCGTADLAEIEDGVNWVGRYMLEGHPLVQCAKEVRASLEMTKDLLQGKKDPPARVAPAQEVTEGNKQDPVKGLIDATQHRVRVGEVPAMGTPNVIVDGSLTLIGSKIKPV